MSSIEEYFGPAIYTYSRRQAIDDGILIDTTKEANAAGFRIPVVLTCAVFNTFTVHKPASYIIDEEETSIMIKLLFKQLYREVIKGSNANEDTIYFTFNDVDLYSVINGGDYGEPVMTVMLTTED